MGHGDRVVGELPLCRTTQQQIDFVTAYVLGSAMGLKKFSLWRKSQFADETLARFVTLPTTSAIGNEPRIVLLNYHFSLAL